MALKAVELPVPKVVPDDAIVKEAARLLLKKGATVDGAVATMVAEATKKKLPGVDADRIQNLITTHLKDAEGALVPKQQLLKAAEKNVAAAFGEVKELRVPFKEAKAPYRAAQRDLVGEAVKAPLPTWKTLKKAGKIAAYTVGAGLAAVGAVEVYDQITSGSQAKSMGPTMQPVASKSFQEDIVDYIRDKVTPVHQQEFINEYSTYEGKYTANQVKDAIDGTLQKHPEYSK